MPQVPLKNKDSRILLLLPLIVLAGITVRVTCFGGYSGSDDGSYAELAYQIANAKFVLGAYDGPPVFPLRLGLIWPVAVIISNLGLSEHNIILYPFIISTGSIVLAYLAGSTLFNARAGLFAAAIQAFIPIDVRLASILLPDMIAAFWANAALLILYLGSADRPVKSKIILGALAGLLIGISWVCKESVLYLFPFIGSALLFSAYRQKENIYTIIAFGLGFALIFCMESLYYSTMTGDFLFRFHEVERNYVLYKSWFFAEGSKYGWKTGESYYLAVIKRLIWHGPRTIFLNTNLGLLSITALAAVGFAFIKKKREFILPGALFLYLLLVYNFGTTSFKFYQPLALLDRYLFPLLLPAAVLTAAALDAAWKRGESDTRRPNAVFGIALATVFTAASLYNHAWNMREGTLQSASERKVARIIDQGDVIYTDTRTPRILQFFWGFSQKAEFRDFAGMKAKNVRAGALVLINRKKAGFLNSWYGYQLPEFYADVPAWWVLEWKGLDAELYRVPLKQGDNGGRA